MRKAMMVEGAAKPGGHYSHAVIADKFVFVAGQAGQDPTTGALSDNFADQVRQTIKNLQIILRGAGADLKDVVKVTTYLTDATRFQEYNNIYKEFFPTEPPVRTTVSCQMGGILIEIDCIALLPS
jgi:2-iminobutanoate/2-iminopropanoate deaminase